MKNYIKIIALFMMCAMILPAVVACQGPSTTLPNDNAGVNAGNTGDLTEGEPEPELLPDGTWYNGYDFHILLGGSFKQNDFAYTEGNEDLVDIARYQRLVRMSETYGISISYEDTMSFGKDSGSGPAYQALSRVYQSQTYEYDAAMVGSYDVSSAAYGGLLYNLNSDKLPYVDITKPWWDQKANEDLMIDDKMFYTTGSISLTSYIVTSCMIFNKDIVVENDNLKNPYEMVRNNEWTWDNFAVEVKKVSDDLNGDGIYNHEDKFGLMTWNDALLSSFASSLSSICSINDDNEIVLTAYTPVSTAIVGKYVDLIGTQNVFNYQQGYSINQWDTTRTAMFDNDQALYYISNFNVIPKHRNSETDFGVLPLPKLNAEQEAYGHLVTASSNQFFCIPYYVEDLERTGGIVEALAYDGYKNLVPAYYEKTLVGKYVRDDESVEMLDLIFASRVYDLGLYYTVANFHSNMMTMVSTKQNTFASIYQSLETPAKTELESINNRFSEVLVD